jgi:hypothetical protein
MKSVLLLLAVRFQNCTSCCMKLSNVAHGRKENACIPLLKLLLKVRMKSPCENECPTNLVLRYHEPDNIQDTNTYQNVQQP